MGDITLTFGSWMIPALITLAAFGRTFYIITREKARYGGSNFGQAIVGLIMVSFSSIASLLAWLVWALLR